MASPTVENYLKAAFEISVTEGARRATTGRLATVMKVSPGTVTSMLKTLGQSGLATYTPYEGVRLTESEFVEHLMSRTQRTIHANEREVLRPADGAAFRSVGVGNPAEVQEIGQPADVAFFQLLKRVADALHADLVIQRAPATLRGHERLLHLQREGNGGVEAVLVSGLVRSRSTVNPVGMNAQDVGDRSSMSVGFKGGTPRLKETADEGT